MAARVGSQASGADDGSAPSIPSAFKNEHMLGVTEAVMWIACRRRFSHEMIREHLKRRALNLQRLTRSPQDSSQDRPQVSPVLQSRVDKAEFQLFRLITDGVPAIGTLDDEGHPDHEKRVPVPVEFLKDGAYIELQSGHIRADLPLEKHYGYQRPTYLDVEIDRDAFFKALAAADPKAQAPAAEVDSALRAGAVSTEHVAPEQEQVEGPGPGRKPGYNWDEFMYEVVRRAHIDGLPDTLAEAEKMMAEWCINHWGERPVDSTIRKKLSPLYGYLRSQGAIKS